jgi:hypothetical protein
VLGTMPGAVAFGDGGLFVPKAGAEGLGVPPDGCTPADRSRWIPGGGVNSEPPREEGPNAGAEAGRGWPGLKVPWGRGPA